MSLIIIGTGLAGYNLAREWRKLQPEQALHLFTQDDGVFYSKPLLSTALQHQKTPLELELSTAEKMSAQLNATVHTNTSVVAIDSKSKTITTHTGEVFHYSQLVLAWGGHVRKLPCEAEKTDLPSVNSLSDYRRFIANIARIQNIGIIGSGLVACEFACDLASQHKTVHVLTPDAYPMAHLLPQAMGKAVEEILRLQGIHLHLKTMIHDVTSTTDGFEIHHGAEHHSLKVEQCLKAIGIQPNHVLAIQAGLTVNRAIVVDSYLQTTQADIYSIGDCAEVMGTWRPYVMPLMQQARTLARTLAGEPTELTYPIMPIVVKIKDHPLSMVLPKTPHEWEITGEGFDLKACCYDQEQQLKGFILLGKTNSERNALTMQLGQ